MKKTFGLILLSLSFTVLRVWGQDAAANRNMAIETFKTELINKPLTNFTFTTLDKKPVALNKLQGQVVVINFWFTTCGPCIKEMPLLNELVTANTDKKVIFLAPSPDDEAYIQKFLRKNVFNYRIIPSALKYINTLHIENYPTHLVVDQKGIVRAVFVGYADDIKQKLQEAIDQLQ